MVKFSIEEAKRQKEIEKAKKLLEESGIKI
jgi:hypothetical protein